MEVRKGCIRYQIDCIWKAAIGVTEKRYVVKYVSVNYWC